MEKDKKINKADRKKKFNNLINNLFRNKQLSIGLGEELFVKNKKISFAHNYFLNIKYENMKKGFL